MSNKEQNNLLRKNIKKFIIQHLIRSFILIKTRSDFEKNQYVRSKMFDKKIKNLLKMKF